MKKKLLIIILVILVIIAIALMFIFKNDEEEPSDNPDITQDSLNFKNEYESVNGTKNSQDQEYRSLTIKEDNPIVYKSAEELATMIENKETFVVYFGFKTCPWCRSMVLNMFDVAQELNLKTIYYVDVSEIRDTKSLDNKNKPITTKEGSEGYYKLLELLDDVLADYTTTNSKGKTISLDEKRIYAPNVVSIIEGKPTTLVEGISSKQTDGYMPLTEEMNNDSKEQLTKVLEEVARALSTCNDERAC